MGLDKLYTVSCQTNVYPKHYRALDLRTKTSTSTRFNSKFLRLFKKKDPGSFILHFYTKNFSTLIYTEGG